MFVSPCSPPPCKPTQGADVNYTLSVTRVSNFNTAMNDYQIRVSEGQKELTNSPSACWNCPS
jgi:hypothetical protein